MTECFVCGNTEGALVAIGLYEDRVYYICKHGHIEAEIYDIVTGLPAYLTSGDDGKPSDELAEIIKAALPT